MKKKVYIVLLNWNGWQDTVSCLESIFRSSYSNWTVVVCDNGSADHSIEYIKAWADGLQPAKAVSKELASLTQPASPKPIAWREYDRAAGEAGGKADDPQLVLIQTGANLGFAGGCNVGIRYALARDDMDYVWLLNNDTVIRPDTLQHMLARMQSEQNAGICGSTQIFLDRPNVVQAYGGAVFNKWSGRSRPIGAGSFSHDSIDAKAVEKQLNYIIGASMLVSRPFLETVGLMADDYFLYYEEIDWAVRGQSFKLVFAPDSIVYHRVGGSTASKISLYYMYINRLKFSWRFFRKFWLLHYCVLWFDVAKCVGKRNWQKADILARILLGLARDPLKR